MPSDIETSIARQIYSERVTAYARPMNRAVTIAALGLLVLTAASCATIEPMTPEEAITPAKPAPQEPTAPAPAPRGPAPRRERVKTVSVDTGVRLR